MPQILQDRPKFKPEKDIEASWNSWRKGLNLLLRPTELSREEYQTGDNIMLVGSGVPTGRWGTSEFFTANATGSVRSLGTFKNTSVNELIATTDEGYLCKKDGVTSTRINGVSFPSGTIVRSEQLGGKTYFVSSALSSIQYDGSSISIYATLGVPTGLKATNYSGASGAYSYSWKVTAVNSIGETTPSTNYVLTNLPQDLTNTQCRLFWTGVSGAVNYQIYRGPAGDETFLNAVNASTTTFVDEGLEASLLIQPPLTNSTGGPKSDVIIKYKDRLLMVDATNRTKLLISGRYPNQFKFNWVDGGGYVYIDPDSGDDIVGLAVQPGSDRIVAYKNNSHYAVELTTVSIGNFIVLDPIYQPISTSIGACNPDVIATVENDTFYFGRKGIYVTGYEPNFLNLIRTNEVSARIRPYLELLNEDDYNTACAFYVNNKYILSFPRRRECVVYDRERGSFVGIWKLPFGISKMLRYVDSTGTEYWLAGSYNSNKVYYFNPATNTDNGTAIQKTFRTNKEIFGKWSLLKIVKMFYALVRRVRGQANVALIAELRDGSTSTIKSFTIEGAAVTGSIGWGIDMWGTAQWGTSDGDVTIAGDELTRYTQLFKPVRLLYVEVTTTEGNANFELIGLRMTASSMGEGSLSSASRV